MMPASTTYKFQMIDVVVRKPFKQAMCDQWATWMLKNQNEVTKAGNYKHSKQADCVEWVWEEFSMEGVKSKAVELWMTSDLGPEIEGYQPGKSYVDCQPSGEETVDGLIADLEVSGQENE